MKTIGFTLDEEVVRRLVERIIRLEVEQETLSRQIGDMVFNGNSLGSNFDEENRTFILWNRLLRLEEEQQGVQRGLQDVLVKDSTGNDGCDSADDSVESRNKLKELLCRSRMMGVKYLTTLSGLSRLIWIVFILFNLLLCSVSVIHSYKHWLVDVTADQNVLIPIGLVPFPAVTVCVDHNIGNARLMDTLLRQCREGTCGSEQLKLLEAAALLHPSLLQTNTLQILNWSNYFNSSSLLFIQQVLVALATSLSFLIIY